MDDEPPNPALFTTIFTASVLCRLIVRHCMRQPVRSCKPIEHSGSPDKSILPITFTQVF